MDNIIIDHIFKDISNDKEIGVINNNPIVFEKNEQILLEIQDKNNDIKKYHLQIKAIVKKISILNGVFDYGELQEIKIIYFCKILKD